jgi:3D (Asp-Asp-Asp) domain-containing protein
MGLFLNLGQAGFLSLNEASSVVVPFQSGYSYNALFLKPIGTQPKNTSPVKIKVTITAYSSTVEQCDNDPFVTASGHTVKEGIIAANFLPFDTRVRIPAIYGDRVFVVQDRMNPKFNNRVDV